MIQYASYAELGSEKKVLTKKTILFMHYETQKLNS